VLVNGRLAVIGQLPELPEEPKKEVTTSSTIVKKRNIYLSGWKEVPVYDLESLSSGETISGPAVVESATTTIVLRNGDEASTTSNQWLDIAVGSR
jgi:N-methylhydantoinase A